MVYTKWMFANGNLFLFLDMARRLPAALLPAPAGRPRCGVLACMPASVGRIFGRLGEGGGGGGVSFFVGFYTFAPGTMSAWEEESSRVEGRVVEEVSPGGFRACLFFFFFFCYLSCYFFYWRHKFVD